MLLKTVSKQQCSCTGFCCCYFLLCRGIRESAVLVRVLCSYWMSLRSLVSPARQVRQAACLRALLQMDVAASATEKGTRVCSAARMPAWPRSSKPKLCDLARICVL